MKRFLNDLSWSFLGAVGSSAILLVATVLVGRLLGPTTYGEFAAMAALAQIISIFLIFGLDKSSMRLIAMHPERRDREQLISFTLFFTLSLTGFLVLVYWAVAPWLSKLLAFPLSLLWVAFFYGFMLSLRQITNNFIRGMDEFRYQSILRLLEAVLTLGLFLLFYFYAGDFGRSYQNYALAIFIAGFFVIVSLLIHLRSYLTPVLKKHEYFKAELSHAKIYFLAAILGVLFGSLDKIVIGKYLSFYELGIYTAYSAVSLNFTAQLNSIMGNVFFPTFSKNLHRFQFILKKVDQWSVLLFLPVLMAVMGVTVVMMFFFGDSYPLNFTYVLLFGILAVLKMIFSMNALLVDVHSKGSLKTAMLWGNISNLTFVVIFLILVYFFELSIPLVLGVLIVYSLFQIGICKYSLYRQKAYDSAAH